MNRPFVESLFLSLLSDFSGTRSYRASIVDDKLNYQIDLPGVRSDDINLCVENGMIVVDAKRIDREYSFLLPLSDEISYDPIKYDPESIVATLESGVLTLELQQLKKKSSTKISIISK